MKKCILILLCSIIGTANAQDPALAENTWYFDNGVINGEPFALPSYLMAQLDFSPTFSNFEVIHPFCEEIMDASIDNIDMEGFSLLGADVVLLGNCDIGQMQLMLPHYRIFADYPDSDIPFNPFTYEIEDTGDYLQLTITNGSGDIAVYNSIVLNNPEFQLRQITFYPNPINDLLKIMDDGLAITDIEIYNITGSIVFTISEIPEKIDLSFLNQGLYLIKASTENGIMFHKMVKE